MPENCSGECSWGWVQEVEWWNFLPENNTCDMSCYCTPPEIKGEFDGQVVFTPCLSSNNLSPEDIINKIKDATRKFSE